MCLQASWAAVCMWKELWQPKRVHPTWSQTTSRPCREKLKDGWMSLIEFTHQWKEACLCVSVCEKEKNYEEKKIKRSDWRTERAQEGNSGGWWGRFNANKCVLVLLTGLKLSWLNKLEMLRFYNNCNKSCWHQFSSYCKLLQIEPQNSPGWKGARGSHAACPVCLRESSCHRAARPLAAKKHRTKTWGETTHLDTSVYFFSDHI